MKIKRVKIGLRPPGTIFREAGQVIHRVEAGKRASPQRGWIYFSDVRAMSKVLTRRRLEILKAVRDHRPESIRALAGLVERDVKNVADDLALLASLGLVEMEVKDRSAGRKAQRVDYETLTLEVHL
jgi:predicted transcriptional regulator